MDLTKLSDAELEDLAKQAAASPPPTPSLSTLSDDQLKDLQKKAAAGIKEEMHPDISAWDRFVVKNFGNDTNASINYLQKEAKKAGKDTQFMEHEGRILAKSPKDAEWRVMEPKNRNPLSYLTNPKEALMDAGDVAYDVGSGLASTVAGGLGALGGAVAGPVGAVAGGMGAAGAVGAGLEGLRQQTGKMLGVNNEIKGGDVALSGATSAVAPVLFGTGAPAAKLVAQGVAPGLANLAEKGVVGAGVNKVAGAVLPKVGEALSGVPANTIKTASEHMPEIQNLEKEGLTDYVTTQHDQLNNALRTAKQEIGENISTAIDQAGGKVNIAGVKKPLQDLITKLESQSAEIKSPAQQEKVDAAKEALLRIFGTGEEGVPDNISARAAMQLKDDLADLASLGASKPGLTNRFSAGTTNAEKQLSEAGRASYQALDNELARVTAQADMLMGPKVGTGTLNKQYKQLSDIQRNLQPFFSTPEKTYSTLKTMGNKPKRMLYEKMSNIDQQYGTDMVPAAKLLDAYSTFARPALDTLSTGGGTSTGKSLGLRGAGAAAGYGLGHQLDPEGMGGMIGAGIGGLGGATLGSPAAMRMYINAANKAAQGSLLKSSLPISGWNAMNPGGSK